MDECVRATRSHADISQGQQKEQPLGRTAMEPETEEEGPTMMDHQKENRHNQLSPAKAHPRSLWSATKTSQEKALGSFLLGSIGASKLLV